MVEMLRDEQYVSFERSMVVMLEDEVQMVWDVNVFIVKRLPLTMDASLETSCPEASS